MKLKIGCWNIGCVLSEINVLKERFFSVIKEDDPEIICLQELPIEKNFIDEICSLGWPFAQYIEVAQSHVSDQYSMGVGVFSRYSLSDLQISALPLPTEEVSYKGKRETFHLKYFVRTIVSLPETKLALYTGHGFPFYRYGLDEESHAFVYEAIDDFVNATSKDGLPYIIAADFNAHDPVRFMPFVSANHYDVFKNTATRPSGRKTDAIIVSDSIAVDTTANRVVESFDHNYLSVTTIATE